MHLEMQTHHIKQQDRHTKRYHEPQRLNVSDDKGLIRRCEISIDGDDAEEEEES